MIWSSRADTISELVRVSAVMRISEPPPPELWLLLLRLLLLLLLEPLDQKLRMSERGSLPPLRDEDCLNTSCNALAIFSASAFFRL